MTATLTETRSPSPSTHPGAGTAPGVTTAAPGAAHEPDGTASHGGGRGGGRGGAMRVDPRDRAQLAETPVPLSRVLALFRGHRARVAVVVAIIVVTCVVALAQPFLVRDVIDVALPQQDSRLLLLAVGAMVAVAVVTAARRRADLALHPRSASGSCTGCAPRSSPTCSASRSASSPAPAAGEVQSRITNDIGGMQSRRHLHRDLDRRQPHHRRRHRRRHGGAVSWRLVAALAGRAAAGDLADPPGRPDAPRDHRRAPARSSPTCTSRSRRASRSAACSSPRPSAPARRWSSGSPRPRPTWSTSSSAPSSPVAGGWRR